MAQLAAPHRAVELLPGNDCPGPVGQGNEQLKLTNGERQGPPSGQHQALAEPDLELTCVKGAFAVLVHGHRP